jgi:hypothetical protein
MCLVVRFLFLILFHQETSFVADIRYYASDVLGNAFVGTIPIRFSLFYGLIFFLCQLYVKLTDTFTRSSLEISTAPKL